MTKNLLYKIAIGCAVSFVLTACADTPYTPVGQDFSDEGYWGEGLPDFNPNAATDTGGWGSGGSTSGGGTTDGDLNGVYLGTYLIDITEVTTLQTCSCATASLTLAIQNNMISIGQGAACVTTCSSQITLNFTGSVIDGGIASGNVDITESANGTTNTLTSSWSGVITGGTASANITASNVPGTTGTYNLTGSFTASKQ
jgi:hypothetical protein